MSLPSVYIETSVVSYLAARPSRDLIVAAHQQITSDWWHNQREQYRLFVSELVVGEASEGDIEMAARRKMFLEGIELLEIDVRAMNLAQQFVEGKAVPEKASADALHIAVACVNGADYLLTWNCKHIANGRMKSRIGMVCHAAGYDPIVICTPEELGGED